MTCGWCEKEATTTVLLERAVYNGPEVRKHAITAAVCPAHAHLGLDDEQDTPPPPLADSLRRRRDRDAEHDQLTIYDMPGVPPGSPQRP